MSWDASDAMEEVVDNCIKGYDCNDVAIRYLEKQLSHPHTTKHGEVLIREKLSKLNPGFDL